MTGRYYPYTGKDNLHTLWHKFSLNISALYEPSIRQSIAMMLEANPPTPLTYAAELYPFRAPVYLQSITTRLNGTLMPTASNAPLWANNNTTSQYIYLDKRRQAQTLTKACNDLLNHLRVTYGLEPQQVVVDSETTQAFSLERLRLRQAADRLGVTQSFIDFLCRVYLLTIFRGQLTEQFSGYPEVVAQTPYLFNAVEEALAGF